MIGRLPQAKTNIGTQGKQNQYHIYKSKEQAVRVIEDNHPLVIYQIQEKLYLIYKPIGQEDCSRSSAACVEVYVDDEGGIFRFGCWFAKLSLCASNTQQNTILHVRELSLQITKNILCLPLIKQDPNQIDVFHQCQQYYLTSDDWDERVGNGSFIKSHVTSALFKSWY